VTAPGVREPHGTDSGYQAHVKCRTPPCGPCRAAHAAAEHRRRHGRHADEIRQLELERLRPGPADLDPVDEAWRLLLDLIAGECRRAGMLP
jgi:hypothetical protein